MGHSVKKHDQEHLDGSRGAWRPAHVATIRGADGHPLAFKRGVVVTCPSCGCQFGVGMDPKGPQIQADGTTDRPVKCQNYKGCPWNEVMTFEKINDSEGQEHFAKLEAKHAADVAETRVKEVHGRIRAQIEAELDERAMVEARKIIANGDAPDAPEKLAQWLKNGGKIGK